MKRITVNCPLVLNMGSQQFVFKSGQTYDVEDTVAAHPYLQAHLAAFIDVTPSTKEKSASKKNAKKTTEKEAESVVEPASDA